MNQKVVWNNEVAGVWWRCVLTRKDSLMSTPRKYDRELQDRAVRLYEERMARGDSISQTKARHEIGELLDVHPGTLRNWIRRAKGEGITPPTGEPVDEELTRLRRENAQLRKANEILKTASAFFAQAELDRKLGS